MKTPLLILLTFWFCSTSAQQTKLKKDKDLMQEYYVLKSDPTIKHGKFKQLNPGKKTVALGYYKANLKDSVWVSYFNEGTTVKSRGKYRNDKKVGIWEYFTADGKTDAKVNEDNGEVIFFKPDDEKDTTKQWVFIENDSIKSVPERKAIYIGGWIEFMRFISFNLRYPDNTKSQDGRVILGFYVLTDGTIDKVKVVQSVDPALDKEAIRLLNMSSGNWIPAVYKNKKAVTYMTCPFNFKIR